MTTKDDYLFRVGDVVCFRSQFLRDIGFYTNVPINGKVLKVSHDKEPHRSWVQWCDNPDLPAWVCDKNLILYEKRHLDV